MSLPRYLEIASHLPIPTYEQIESFARHIRYAHSWYKHLPILPPGRPFHFFLDPGAGLSRIVRTDGQFGVQSRSDQERFHHAWFSTDETRRRFGYLAYAVLHPRTEYLDHDLPSLLDPEMEIDVHLPRAAVEAGRTDVSGLIHPLGTNEQLILLQSRYGLHPWPAETGGGQQAEAVLARCQALMRRLSPKEPAPPDAILDDTERWALSDVDWTLYQLLAPERQRQLEGMVQAALRAVAFVHGAVPDRRT